MTAARVQPVAVVGPREVERRRRAVRAVIGRQLLEAREEGNLSRRTLAAAAGMDAAYLWKIELGRANPSLDVLVALAAQLGSEVSVRFFPTAGPRIRDRFQAPMIEGLLGVLDRRWLAQPEIPVRDARGVLDLVLRERGGSCVVACECHSELRRLEVAIRRLAEKAAALQAADGTERDVSRLLLLRSTVATRRLVNQYEATFAAAFPARAADAIAALTGTAAWPGPAVLWMEVEGGKCRLLDGPPRSVRLGR